MTQIAIHSGVIKSSQTSGSDLTTQALQQLIDSKHPSSNHPASKAMMNRVKVIKDSNGTQSTKPDI